MYLSCLLINVGTNPDRPRPGRQWLRNLYRVHQRLCMAFPSDYRQTEDPQFLDPYSPADFCQQRVPNDHPGDDICSEVAQAVHTHRNGSSGFLYRIDPQPSLGRAVILVQSALLPDWEYAFQNAHHLLAALPEVKPFLPRFQRHQSLRFHIQANPVRKVSRNSLDFNGKPFDERWIGKDVPVPTNELDKWLKRRAEPGWATTKNSEGKQPPPGFRLDRITSIQDGFVFANKPSDNSGGRRIRSARYEGVLAVTDAENFLATLVRGIGPGKAFGFGLVSVAPVEQDVRQS